jgi:hypothetical protein
MLVTYRTIYMTEAIRCYWEPLDSNESYLEYPLIGLLTGYLELHRVFGRY